MDTVPSLKSYLRPNTFYSLLVIARDWIAIVLIAALNIRYPSIWLYIPSVWLIGAFQFALGESMLHDASHHTLFARKSWHYRLDFLYALPFWITVKEYRKEHLVHHSYLGKDKDRLVTDYRKLGFQEPVRHLFWLWFLKPVTGFAGLFYIHQLTLKPFKSSGIRILIFWAVIVTGFALMQRLDILLLYWVVPYVWCFYSYLYWSEVSDHFHTETGTRSNLNPLSNLITHNNGYHYLHHKYPTIPWFRLPDAYNDFGKGEGDISGGFLDTYRQMKKANLKA
ncbi:fatty acid desaturase family protein [Chitinophaga nivalis]|uniref:Fatty acid desaturase n=1 Tax=Chitinophaga nivalis TaxID=2991709 RepID=A0ABT3ILY2_9BACT|nr:fatty acid desaturase [Chitinophaga nivalis]MCW3465325.1 fatty acid desaturase [Chitinophaga nivalis]MCW3484983.1 fatty acid desaturase [Chitinophaga nivalis]